MECFKKVTGEKEVTFRTRMKDIALMTYVVVRVLFDNFHSTATMQDHSIKSPHINKRHDAIVCSTEIRSLQIDSLWGSDHQRPDARAIAPGTSPSQIISFCDWTKP